MLSGTLQAECQAASVYAGLWYTQRQQHPAQVHSTPSQRRTLEQPAQDHFTPNHRSRSQSLLLLLLPLPTTHLLSFLVASGEPGGPALPNAAIVLVEVTHKSCTSK